MSFHRPIQLVVLIALVVSGSVALAQEQGQQGPTEQPIDNGMSHDQMMHQQMVPGNDLRQVVSHGFSRQLRLGAGNGIVRRGAAEVLPAGTYDNMGDPFPGDGHLAAGAACARRAPQWSLKESRHSHPPLEATTTDLLFWAPRRAAGQ
jgi:hypothetical protein